MLFLDIVPPNVVPTIDMEIPGNLIETLHISKLPEDDLYLPKEIPGYLGAGYEFELGDTFDKPATLTYKFNPEFLNKEGFNPAIYYCDTENQEMVLLENQTIDLVNCTVSVPITHFSKYILIDKTQFDKAFEEDEEDSVLREPIMLGIGIDVSNNVEGFIDDSKSTAKEIMNLLFADDWKGILSYSQNVGVSLVTKDLTTSLLKIDSIVPLDQENVSLSYGLNMTLGLVGANYAQIMSLDSEDMNSNNSEKTSMLKSTPARYIIIFTDGNGSYSPFYTGWAEYQGVKVYTVGIGNNVNEQQLRTISQGTGGEYFHISNRSELISALTKILGKNIDKVTDTDNDGLSDYHEERLRWFNGITIKTDTNNPDTDGDGILDGQEVCVVVDQKNNVHHYKMYSNPTLEDTDYDGISDKEEVFGISQRDNNLNDYRMYFNPRVVDTDYDGISNEQEINKNTNAYVNDFKGEITANGYTFDINFKMDYRKFFGKDYNKKYDDQMAQLGSIYATLAYGNNISLNSGATFNGEIKGFFEKFGLKDVKVYSLAQYFDDDDVSEIVIGHRKVTYNNITKDIVIVAVRGTNSTIEEWSSNFDVGADTVDYWDRKNPYWRNKLNHKGFDVAANRLYDEIERYIDTLDSGTKKSIFIVGHSRGAAVANILGAKFEEDTRWNSYIEPYIYGFATPNTTVAPIQYDTVFSIVNKDDIVPYLPLEQWGFSKYGRTYTVSVKDSYENKFGRAQQGTWENIFHTDYNFNGNKEKTIAEFGKVASSREEVYQFSNDNKSIYTYATKYNTHQEAEYAAQNLSQRYGTRINKFTNIYVSKRIFHKQVGPRDIIEEIKYQVDVKQKPAAFMMILTDVISTQQYANGKLQPYNMRGSGEEKYKGLVDVSFYVAPIYKDAKNAFVWGGADSAGGIPEMIRMGGMVHTHMPGTYYFLSCDYKDLIPD